MSSDTEDKSKRRGSSSSLSEMFSHAATAVKKKLRRGSNNSLPHHKKLQKNDGHRLSHSSSGSQFSTELFNRTEEKFEALAKDFADASKSNKKDPKWLGDIRVKYHLHKDGRIGISDEELRKFTPDNHVVGDKIREQIESSVRNHMVHRTMDPHGKNQGHSNQLADPGSTSHHPDNPYEYDGRTDDQKYTEVEPNPYETSLKGPHTNYEGKTVDSNPYETVPSDNIYEDPGQVVGAPSFNPKGRENQYEQPVVNGVRLDGGDALEASSSTDVEPEYMKVESAGERNKSEYTNQENLYEEIGPAEYKKQENQYEQPVVKGVRLDGGDALEASSSTDVEPKYMKVESAGERNKSEYKNQENLYEEIGPAESGKDAPPLPPRNPKMMQRGLENPPQVNPPQVNPPKSTLPAPPLKKRSTGKEVGR